MKRRTVAAVMLCILIPVLAACSQNTGGSDGPTAPAASLSMQTQPVETGSQPAATVPATDTKPNTGAIDLERVSFVSDFDEFFGGDAKAALQRMEPILLAAAQAVYAGSDGMAGAPDDASKWAVVYQYLNTYGDNDFEKQKDGTLIVGRDDMLLLFRSIFGADSTLPELKTEYNIQYDDKTGQYFIGRSDFGEVSFALTDLALSDTDAFITLTANEGSASQFDVLIEVTPGADSRFGYSILQITQLCGYT